MSYDDLIAKLVLGTYAFTSGSYVWSWILYKRLVTHLLKRIEAIESTIDNHYAHRLDDVERRLAEMEHRG